MQKRKQKLTYVIIFLVLVAAEAALITLYTVSRGDNSTPLLGELYVAGILICAILLVFLLLTRLGPSLLLKNAKRKLMSLKATTGETALIDPEGLKERLLTALQKGGFVLSDTQITQSGGDFHVTVASAKAFSLFFDRMYRYVIITEDFRKTRDFDTLRRFAQNLTDAEDLPDDARARSGFATLVVLLMAHVPEQVQTACHEEASAEGPAYVPVACDLSAGKAYFLSGKTPMLPEFRSVQRMIKKYVIGKVKK